MNSALSDRLLEDIALLVECYSEKEAFGRQSLMKLLVSDPLAFRAASVRLLATAPPSPGTRYLLHLLSREKLLISGLLDTAACRLDEAIPATRAALEAGLPLQIALALDLATSLQEHVSSANTNRILRSMDLLAATCPPTTWNSLQLELAAYPDKLVRSKAALLVGQSGKNAEWIGRRLLDNDARVQANAAEALWYVDPDSARPFLRAAAKSHNSRMAANALLGLYRHGDREAIPKLLNMAQDHAPASRLSAFWAMGETGDPRFLPFLADRYRASEGRMRHAVTSALARIRRREKLLAETGALDLRVSQAIANSRDRLLVCSLRSSDLFRLEDLKAVDVIVFEADTLILDYEFKAFPQPRLLVIGFVSPQPQSADDPYAGAIAGALARCLEIKRSADLWRIDQYSVLDHTAGASAPAVHSSLPYDDPLLTSALKMSNGFFSDFEFARRILASPVPPERLAADAGSAIARQCGAIARHAGERHVFVFLEQDAGQLAADEIRTLQDCVQHQRIVLHAIAIGADTNWTQFRSLCQSHEKSTFDLTSPEQLPRVVEDLYAQLMNRFEITYSMSEPDPRGLVTLRIVNEHGIGRAEVSLKVA